jgi:hypothetical protein
MQNGGEGDLGIEFPIEMPYTLDSKGCCMRSGSRLILSLCLSVLCAGLAIPQAKKTEKPGTGGGTVGYVGSVKSVDHDSKVIELDKGLRFSIDEKTEIVQSGRSMVLADIKAGDKVSVQAKAPGAKNTVTHADKVSIK